MAQVYLTVSDELGASKLAVVKQLRPELAREDEYRGMFLDEARIAVRLHHPNIVQTYEVGERDGGYFIAMEYLEGQPLNVVLQRAMREHFPEKLHLHAILETLRGLAYAHELKDFDGKPLAIVHRDISPHNVFLTYDGQVKIVDFGIAKAKSSTERTKTGIFKGKPTYSSPEQALGEAVDQRADVFSVGVMLWEALARRRMWGDKSETSVLLDLVNDRRPKLAEAAPDAPRELVEICEKALRLAPDDRYQTSREFLEALEAHVDAHAAKATSKELGARVSELFSTERERIRQTIEEQMRQVSSVSAIRATVEGGAPVAAVPTLLQLAGLAAPGTDSGDRSRPKLASSGSARTFIAAAGGVFGALALVWIATHSFGNAGAHAAEVTPPSAASPREAAPSLSASKPDTVKIQVQTDPDRATVLLDGQPFDPSARLPRDSSTHRLSIAAPGYEPRNVDVVLDDDHSLSVALRQVSPKAPIGRTQPAPPAPAPKKASASIDEESPYKR